MLCTPADITRHVFHCSLCERQAQRGRVLLEEAANHAEHKRQGARVALRGGCMVDLQLLRGLSAAR